MAKRETKSILGVKIDFGLTYDDVISEIEKLIIKGQPTYICTVNPEFVIEAQKDDLFKSILNNSYLSLPDGIGVVIAKDYLQNTNILKRDYLYFPKTFILGIKCGFDAILGNKYVNERNTGTDLVNKLCEWMNNKNYNIYFFGGSHNYKPESNTGKNMAKDAISKISNLYKNVNIIGGTSNFSYEEKDDIKAVEEIKNDMRRKKSDRIDVLLVALGHKKQEKWIFRNSSKIPAIVSIGVGAAFNFITGDQVRSSLGYINHNMEWLYRLITNPRRLGRIINATIRFPIKIFISANKHQ